MKLSINLATRGRPQLLIETLLQTVSNIARPDTTLMVSVDLDDFDTRDAVADYRRWQDLPDQVHIDCRVREDSLGAKYNRVLKAFPADVYLAMVDYAPHITPAFDQIIIDAAAQFPDGIGVVYNPMANLAFPGINAVTHGLVERMGFLYPPYWPVWFIDHWLDDIARMIGRVAYAEVGISTSRRPGTQNLRDLPFWAEFYNRLAPVREECAAEIISHPKFLCRPWERKFLPTLFPLTRQRSAIINSIAVQQNAGKPPAEDDERHQRLRAEARKMVAELGQPPIEFPAERQRHPYGVIFATPCLSHHFATEYDDSKSRTMLALAAEQIPFEFMKVLGDPFVDHARDKLLTWFLEMYPDAENFFFLDDDIGWPEDKIIEFLVRPEGVIAGIYEKKQKDKDYPVALETTPDGELVEVNGLLRAVMAPTGFMRVKRWAIEKVIANYETFWEPQPDGSKKTFYAPFQHGIGNEGTWVGEDSTFVRRCITSGIDVWIDPDVELSHRGTHVWKCRLRDDLDEFRKSAKTALEL